MALNCIKQPNASKKISLSLDLKFDFVERRKEKFVENVHLSRAFNSLQSSHSPDHKTLSTSFSVSFWIYFIHSTAFKL